MSDEKKPREWWIWSQYDTDQEWFIHGLFATKNMWEIGNERVIHVVEYESMRMKVIGLECEVNHATFNLLSVCEERDRYREALEFYAQKPTEEINTTWSDSCEDFGIQSLEWKPLLDLGEIARQALTPDGTKPSSESNRDKLIPDGNVAMNPSDSEIAGPRE